MSELSVEDRYAIIALDKHLQRNQSKTQTRLVLIRTLLVIH
jgi:hypothetical protein